MSQSASPFDSAETDLNLPFPRFQYPAPCLHSGTVCQYFVNEVSRSIKRARDEAFLHFGHGRVDMRTEYSNRCIYSQPGRAKRPRLQQTLFELLPIDICSRIAAYVSCGNPTQDALHLGETSPHLRNAVVSTLSYKYVCINSWYYSQDVVKRWAVLFSADLQGLTILQPRCSDRDAYEFMLNSPSLKTVELQDTTYAMHQHLISTQITTLTITLTGVLPHLLFSSIPSPSVRDLTLSCMGSKSGSSTHICCAVDLVCEWNGARRVKAAFPNLRAIEIRCRCNCDKNLLWELVRCLPKLEEVRIDDVLIPENMQERVRDLKAVTVANLSTGLMLAHTVGAPLISLQTREIVEERDLQYDELWTGLTSISIALGTGAEPTFLETVPLFSETLRTLRLSRSAYEEYHNEMREDAGLPCDEPEDGIWLAIVMKLPHLQNLGLRNINVGLGELIAIIKHVGERLQILEITLEMEQEHALVRLERVLLTAAVHCPSLRTLNVETGEFHGPEQGLGLFYYGRIMWVANMGRRLGRALEILKRRSPFFDDESLKMFVRKLANL